VLLALTCKPDELMAQRIPAQEYIHYLPLDVPRPIRETDASKELHLFGDRTSPAYRDVVPRDGIDDTRHEALMRLAVEFAPILIQNTSMSAPLDHRRLTDAEGRRSVYWDTWNMKSTRDRLIESVRIDLDDEDTSELKRLIADYHPSDPGNARSRAVAIRPDTSLVEVVYLDLPGATPHEWDSIYVDPQTGAMRERYHSMIHSFVHPFINGDEESGYELLLQFWFFYPFNDGGNNHTGDWEHINVVITPLDKLDQPLDRTDIETILTVDDGVLQSLVIRRLEYYTHNNVITLDFSSPNAYTHREGWAVAKDAEEFLHAGEEWIADRIRYRAFQDQAETVINKRAVVYIGADNKGTDQILSPPGGSNRDSHACYPFAGLYKDIGPAGAAEEIDHLFMHKKYFESTEADRQGAETFKKKGVLDFARRDRLTIVPDVDRVEADMLTDDQLLRDWWWIVAPVRWGYPAIESPFAGIVAHAETGNLAAVGPSLNDSWNRSGETAIYKDFDAHPVPGFFPSNWQDDFKNSFGYFNLIWPTLSYLPPFDLIYKGLLAPVRLVLEKNTPNFFARSELPTRFIGLQSGVAAHRIPEEFSLLLYNSEQVGPLLVGIVEHFISQDFDSTTTAVGDSPIEMDAAVSAYGQVNFFLGNRFVSENNLRHSRSGLKQQIDYTNIDPLVLTATLNMWEYYGSLRYNVLAGSIQPFAKIGYGLSWYRYEDTSVSGKPISVPDSPWIRKPDLGSFSNILPNTLHVGAGLDVLALKGYEPHLLAGLDVAFKVEWMLFRHALGIQIEDIPIKELLDLGIPVEELPLNTKIWRHALQFGVTVSL
jgi:hypothetical protein